jgi:hypothetical protein
VDGAERVLWPKIFDLASARRAAKAAVAISCFIAGIIVLLVLTSLGLPQSPLSRPPAALIDAGLWLAIAFGIYKMSRVAAVAALALLLYNIAWVGGVFSWPPILFAIFLFSGVRATFVYHRISNREQAAA